MSKSVLIIALLVSTIGFGQEKGNFYGGFESNSQWYVNDKNLKTEFYYSFYSILE